MNKNSMTALVSTFARAYHSQNSEPQIYDDPLAAKMLTTEEYSQISQNMTAGIKFFNPQFSGNEQEALLWIVNNQLAPSPLGRSAFCCQSLANAVKIGAKQYLIFGAGYDTFPYRQPTWSEQLQIFEIDHPDTAADKKQRLQQANLEIPANVNYIAANLTKTDWSEQLKSNDRFDSRKISFCSLLGLVYYLPKNDFCQLLQDISQTLPQGSSAVFDYPDSCFANSDGKKQAMMAKAAGEPMNQGFTYQEMESILAKCGFLIYEHLTPQNITERFFSRYNQANPQNPMRSLVGVNYCLAVKK